MYLVCVSKGARPAAVISWFNESNPLFSEQVNILLKFLLKDFSV